MTHMKPNDDKSNKENKSVYLAKDNNNENSKDKLKESVVVNMNYDEGILF